MKKKLMIFGVLGVVLMLAGAVAIEKAVFEPNTISDWSDLYSICLSRTTPPIPDIDALAVYEQLKAEDYSFMDEKWFRTESLGTVYVSKQTEELAHLDLPVTVRIYTYPSTELTYILSSKDGTNFVAETSFPAILLADDSIEALNEKERQSYLLFATWDMRAVYEVTLKSEDDAWSDLLSEQQTVASFQSLEFVAAIY